MTSKLKIAIVVGEYSGDEIGASLVKGLQDCFPACEIYGITGPKLRQLGVTTLESMENICVMGLTEVLKHLPRLLLIRRRLKKYLIHHRPDIYIGIDAPDFNLPIEHFLKKKLNVFTIHYGSPTVWAWRKNRVYSIEKAVNLLLCLFPFEPACYQGLNVQAEFIGHPFADKVKYIPNKPEARQALGLDLTAKIIALLPGSRSNEIKKLGKVFLQTANVCFQKDKNLIFVLPAVHQNIMEQLQKDLQEVNPDLPIFIQIGRAHEMISASDVVLVASGTATLEVLCLARPMVVAYKLSKLSYWLLKKWVHIAYIALPNILANKRIVPEFIQEHATPEHLAEALLHYLENENSQLIKQFEDIFNQLKQDSVKKAVSLISDVFKR